MLSSSPGAFLDGEVSCCHLPGFLQPSGEPANPSFSHPELRRQIQYTVIAAKYKEQGSVRLAMNGFLSNNLPAGKIN